MAPSINLWPQDPIVMGSKSPVAADVARQASQIVHFSEMKSGKKRGLYDRRTVFVLVLAVAAHTNLFDLISAICIVLRLSEDHKVGILHFTWRDRVF
jgi:hypothetical protein